MGDVVLIVTVTSLTLPHRSKWQEKEARLQRTVTWLLTCDMNQPRLLGSAQVPAVACVLTLLALECAYRDVDAYRAAIQSLVGLLKPGGYLVTSVALNCQNYMVGPSKFFSLPLEKETVEKALQEAGCQVLKSQYSPINYSKAYRINEGHYFVVTHKDPRA